MARRRDDFDHGVHGSPEPRRVPAFGLWAAALFNICAVVLPLAGAYAAHVVVRDHLYTYEPTEGAARQARAALDKLARGLIEGEDRRRQWDNHIAVALMEGDIAAARGFAVSARAMLPAADVSIINRAVSANPTDADLEAAALALLTPGTQARYLSTVPLLSRRAATETSQSPARRPFIVLGDRLDFENASLVDLNDPNADHLGFVLMGIGVLLPAQLSENALAGASIVQAGLNARRLPPRLYTALAERAEAALPRARFKSETDARMTADAPDRVLIFDAAFRAALDPAALEQFTRELETIGVIGEAASPQGALTLLAHARGFDDLPRLALLAQTNADRAVAVAKRLPANGALPDAGRGWLNVTPDLAVPLIVAALALLGMAFAALATAAQAIAHTLEQWRIIDPPAPPSRHAHNDDHDGDDGLWRGAQARSRTPTHFR